MAIMELPSSNNSDDESNPDLLSECGLLERVNEFDEYSIELLKFVKSIAESNTPVDGDLINVINHKTTRVITAFRESVRAILEENKFYSLGFTNSVVSLWSNDDVMWVEYLKKIEPEANLESINSKNPNMINELVADIVESCEEGTKDSEEKILHTLTAAYANAINADLNEFFGTLQVKRYESQYTPESATIPGDNQVTYREAGTALNGEDYENKHYRPKGTRKLFGEYAALSASIAAGVATGVVVGGVIDRILRR